MRTGTQQFMAQASHFAEGRANAKTGSGGQQAQSTGFPYAFALVSRIHHATTYTEHRNGCIVNAKKIATRVCVLQRIVQTVAVVVEVLAVVRHLHIFVGAEEPDQGRGCTSDRYFPASQRRPLFMFVTLHPDNNSCDKFKNNQIKQ